ncbi:MAG: D-alanine--D-alanine ligase [Thermodesulfobacteriota bacterium]
MKQVKKTCVALLAGGKSGEREVSLKGAAGFLEAIDRTRFEVLQYDPATDLAKLAADSGKIDVAFILLHGLYGEDGTVQGFLDLLGIPYQGSGVLGSAIAMNKHLSKELYRQNGLPVADWVMARPEDMKSSRRILERLDLPLVIKPACEGSSLGMSIAETEDELMDGITEAFRYDSEVMVEQFIRGRELTCGVLGNEELTPLPLVEIIPGEEYRFFDYEAKYQPGASTEICPAEVDDEIRDLAMKYGVEAHKVLRLRGYSRTDMILDEQGRLYLLETNTIPGMTPTSLLPQAAAEYGLGFSKLIERLLELAVEKKT